MESTRTRVMERIIGRVIAILGALTALAIAVVELRKAFRELRREIAELPEDVSGATTSGGEGTSETETT